MRGSSAVTNQSAMHTQMSIQAAKGMLMRHKLYNSTFLCTQNAHYKACTDGAPANCLPNPNMDLRSVHAVQNWQISEQALIAAKKWCLSS